jgi:type IV secretory pathway VirD2 relaxase
MAALRSVVKHSYLTGKNEGVGRAQAHVKYIQFRAGKDRDEEPRSFFNGSRDDITGREVARAVSDQNPRGTVMHKLILSPGVQGADVKEYCREVMADLSSRKGLELEWYAVRHDNTAHPHVHIVVMGTDENAHKVRLTKDDYTKIKEAGDRYLERNRLLDREEKDREKDKDRVERNPVTRFVDALKVAAREFSREISRDNQPDRQETKFEQRRREKQEERQKEIDALGETIDLDDYLVKQAAKEERDQENNRAEIL